MAFVGRRAELEALSLALERTSSGESGSLTVIEGEAGIGKTRLCEELELLARQSNIQVVWTHSQDGSGEPPYWPWIQILRSLTADEAGQHSTTRLQPATQLIAAHIPQLSNLAGGDKSTSRIGVEHEQFQLRDSICSLVTAYAVENPLMLVFDDLHWADPSSISTLNMLSERVGSHKISLLATVRPVEPGSSTSAALTNLKRAQSSGWIPLAGLDDAQARDLLTNVSSQSGTERGLTEALRLSEGNPFFLTELAASWDQLDLNRSLTLPSSAIDVVSSRLSGVPTETLNVLHTASLLGREFDIARLIAVSSPADDDLVTDAIEIGLQRRIVEERDGARGLFRFIHEITRQVLSRRGTAIGRAKSHAQIADRLETYFSDRSVENASEIAFHWQEAGTFGDAEKRAIWAIAAGSRALDAYEFDSAFSHFNYAVKPSNRLTNERLLAEAQEGIGFSLSGLERGGEAVEFLREAFDYFVRVGETSRAVSIAQMYLGSPSGMAGMVSIQERALLIDGISGPDAARVKVPLARATAIVLDDYVKARAMIQDVIEFARKHGDLPLEMHAAGHGAQFAGFQRRYADMRDFAEMVINIGSKIDDPFSVSAACVVLSQLNFGQGRGEADELIERGKLSAVRTRVSHRISTAFHYEQRIAVERCMWDEARAAAHASMETGFADPRVLALSIGTEFQTGNFLEGESLLKEFLGTPINERRVGESSAQFFRLMARSTLDPAHIAITRSEANDANRAPNAFSRSFGLITLGWIAIDQGDRDSAAGIREQLLALGLEDSEQAVMPSLAHIAGLPEAAIEEFELLLPMFESRGHTLTTAWIKYDYARFLIDHPETRPELTGASVAAEGRGLALDHGLIPLVNRFQELLDQVPATDAATHGLSRRELEVLALLAGGRSNREIAEELFISPATVNRHVSNLFGKLGVSNRASATDLAHRSGLVQ